MATALTIPTATTILNVFALESGAIGTIGSINEAAINADIAANATSNVPQLAFNEAVWFWNTENGYDTGALHDTDEWPYVDKFTRILAWRMYYEQDRFRRQMKGEKCDNEEQYKDRIKLTNMQLCELITQFKDHNSTGTINKIERYCGFEFAPMSSTNIYCGSKHAPEHLN